MEDKIGYLKSLPKKRIGASIIFLNKDKELLVLKLSYKRDGWGIPGGVVDEFESPIKAAIREAKEEIGIKVKVLNCLVVDFTKEKIGHYISEGLQFVFFGGILKDEEIKKIKIDNEEIVDFKFVSLKKAEKILRKNISKRVVNLDKKFKNFVFLENGKRII